MSPIFVDSVFDMQSMWFFQVRFSSINTHKNVMDFTLSSLVSFIISRFVGAFTGVIWGVPSNIKFVLGITSKLNRRLTAGDRRFRSVVIVLNNVNRRRPPVTGGQPPVEFWSDPLVALTDNLLAWNQFFTSFNSSLIKCKQSVILFPEYKMEVSSATLAHMMCS